MNDISKLSDRDFRRWLISRLKVDQALEPDNELYVPFYDGVEGDPIELLYDDIDLSVVESLNFISGFRGSGKTTELFRLRRRLVDHGYFVAYANALDYLLPSEPVEISDLLLVLAGSFSEAIEKSLGIDLATEGFWSRFVSFLARTKVKIEGFDFKTGIPGTDVGLNVKTSLKDEPTFRRRLREKLAVRLGELRNEVYDFFDFGRKKIHEVKGDCGIVFIFDEFEQLRDTHDTQGRVAESVTTLIANHRDDLCVRSLHMIFTLPPWLKFRLPALRGVRLLYNMKLWNNNDKRTPAKPGWDVMREIVRRRFSDEGMTRFFGPPTDAGKYAGANKLIAASGGHFRDLIWLLHETVLRAKDLPCTAEQVSAAERNLRDSFLPLSVADARLLNQIEQQRNCVLEDSALDDIQRVTLFLDTHAALILRNGDEWYDVHPLIRGEVEEIIRRDAEAKKT